MEQKMIVAIVRTQAVEKLEGRLIDMGSPGFSISEVKGCGEYANFFNPDWKVTHARIEIVAQQSKVDDIVAAILDSAHTSMTGDGIVAVLPVEKLYRIRTKTEVSAGTN